VLVASFREIGLGDVPRVGGKSAHLGDLTRAGFPVPPGFAVPAEAFDAVVRGEVAASVEGLDPADVEALERRAAELRALVEALPVPARIAEAITEAYGELAEEVGVASPAVAVRSSAIAEDAADASFAGMQSTELWVHGLELVPAVRRCWASYFNAEALVYRARQGGEAGMSVAVQAMVDARVAGVLFTLNPLSGDPATIAIEASYGLGVTVVGGDVTPDSYLVSKVTRELLQRRIGAKEVECVVDPSGGGTLVRDVDAERRASACLIAEEVAQLADLGRRVERHYGRPQDVEWAIDRRSGEIQLLQARPETVWSQRRRPVAAASPLAAIAATYLGRHAR
jgi:pyruvate,water dikinase